jgi:hypothetical protein
MMLASGAAGRMGKIVATSPALKSSTAIQGGFKADMNAMLTSVPTGLGRPMFVSKKMVR